MSHLLEGNHNLNPAISKNKISKIKYRYEIGLSIVYIQAHKFIPFKNYLVMDVKIKTSPLFIIDEYFLSKVKLLMEMLQTMNCFIPVSVNLRDYCT